MEYHDITTSTKKNFRINTPGTHVFYFHNKSADLSFTIAHTDAKLYVFGLYEGADHDRFTLITRQKHIVPGAQSHILIKGIFDGHARFSYEGMIHLLGKATKTDAALESRNLLLSEHAHVSAKPQLEILPADVRCTHAATISPLNKEHIDALMMRGLAREAAQKILIAGFANDLITKLQEKAPQAQPTSALYTYETETP